MSSRPQRDASAGARRLGRIAVHPLLLAAYPTLALWSANVSEVLPGEVWPVLWPPVVVTSVLWAIAAGVLRSIRRGALVASAAAVVTLNLGRVVESGARWAVVGALAAVVTVVAVLAWRASRPASVTSTAILNVSAVVMVLMTLPVVLPRVLSPSHASAAEDLATGTASGTASRDIWYLIPDRYPRADTLASDYGFDNTPFLSHLEDQGFQILDGARANYPKTAHSLAATWNLDYLQELIGGAPDGGDWQPVYALLRDHRLGRILTDAGYEYVHLGTWWSPTAAAVSAHDVRRLDTNSEFETVWRSQTALPALLGQGEGIAELDDGWDLRQQNRHYTAWQLDELDRLAKLPGDGPRFVLAHITLPHGPYVFDRDGSLVTEQEAEQRGDESSFVRQVEYANARITDLVDTLLAGPDATDPIIVIQSDEGPDTMARRRIGPSYDWLGAPLDAQQRKLRTVSAIHLPNATEPAPEDLSGVNTWRYILDQILGTDLGLLEDRVYVFPDESRLYEFHDVTSDVR